MNLGDVMTFTDLWVKNGLRVYKYYKNEKRLQYNINNIFDLCLVKVIYDATQ